ncbi:MAG: hypothetical protein AAF620_00160 [Bacteroidota bacterium]
MKHYTLVKFRFEGMPKEAPTWRLLVKNAGDIELLPFQRVFKKKYLEQVCKSKYGLAICKAGGYLPVKNLDQIIEIKTCSKEEMQELW